VGAPETPGRSAGGCFESENPPEIPAAMAMGPASPRGAAIPIVPLCFGRALAAAAHHASAGTQCRPHAPGKPRSGLPLAMGARQEGVWGDPQRGPASVCVGRASPPISTVTPDGGGRKEIASRPAPWLGTATITPVPGTPSPVKPPLRPAALRTHRLPKARWEHPRCQPSARVLCLGDTRPPCCTGTGDGSGQPCPRPQYRPLLLARKTS